MMIPMVAPVAFKLLNKIWKRSSHDTFVDMSKIAYLIELGRGRVDCKE